MQQTRIIKNKFLYSFRENWLQSLLKPILYGYESIDGWFKTNHGLIWRDKTTRNVDEHFHYALATTFIGNHANMLYSCMLTEKLSVPLFSLFKFDN